MAAVFLVAAVLPSVQRAARRASTARLLAFTSDMKPQHLNSPNNPRLKLAKRLHARRQREKTGLILLEGQRLIADALDAGLSADFVLVSDEQLRDGALDRLLARVPAEIAASTTAPLFRDVSDTTTPAGVLALFQKPILTLPPSPSLVLVCDSIGDPGNLGTLLRASAAAGVDGCLLMAGCADPWGPKALRAGMGAQFRVPMMQVPLPPPEPFETMGDASLMAPWCRWTRGPVQPRHSLSGGVRFVRRTRAAHRRTTTATGATRARSWWGPKRTASRGRCSPTRACTAARSQWQLLEAWGRGEAALCARISCVTACRLATSRA